MDTFMDKLAQKLNAQEMIRANSVAEAEELGKLRNQVAEYNQCLAKLQKLLEDGEQKLEGAKVDGAEINRLVEESIAKISDLQKDTESIDEMKAVLAGLKDSLDAALQEQEQSLSAKLEDQKSVVAAQLEDQNKAVVAKLDESNENVHKECVKVYRNVQAVVVEENGKQTESLTNSVAALKGKLNAVLGVSITAMILALAGVVLQVLNLLNFKLF